MARTRIPVKEGLHSDYTSIIVSYSNGIDSTGALYWAVQNFCRSKIILLYCDTGLEYPENLKLFYQTAKIMCVKAVILKAENDFIGILTSKRYMWPDAKVRWCTFYLKTDVTDRWIRENRHILGKKCLFVSGERREESKRRSELPELEYHSTTLKTKRKGDFICHWFRPCLDYEKGVMFDRGRILGLKEHFCYEYLNRCSCMACVFMSNKHAKENMKRYPNKFRELVQAELQISHTWKKKQSLKDMYDEYEKEFCLDIDDVVDNSSKIIF